MGSTPGAFRGFATYTVDFPSIGGATTACVNAAFAGAQTTDRVLATPQAALSGTAVFGSARVSGANQLEFCARNIGLLSTDPGPVNVFVAVYIPSP